MSAPAARLEVVAGKALGMSILVEDELVIGRHAEGPGRLADDEEISRSHARLVYDARGVCAIEDLGSTNGTFLNGLRISVPRTLAEGDTIEIGATTLVLRDLPRPAPPAAGPEPAPQAAPIPGITPPSTSFRNRSASPRNVSLRLAIDFDAREARLSLDDASEPVRLAFDAQATG